MKNHEQKSLIKLLTEKKKEMKNKNVIIERTAILKKPRVDKKYVSDSDYKELLSLYDLIKENSNITNVEIESLIENNAMNFPFLKKCLMSIYDFVSELRCGGPYYIAKEMSRQGKEIDYINNYILKSNKDN